MRGARLAVMSLLLLAVVGFALLFYLQNQDTEVRLFMDLGFQAWATRPQPVPGLLLGVGLSGFLLGLLFGVVTASRRRRPSSSLDDHPL